MFKDLHEKRVKTFPGFGLVSSKRPCLPVDLTNKNSVQLFHELSLLLAAKQAGNITLEADTISLKN